VLRDIDIALAMREHLAEANPELTTAVSFIGSVCGRSYAPKGETMTGPVISSTKRSVVVDTPPPVIESSEHAKPPTIATNVGKMVIRGIERGGGDVESDSDHETTDIVVLEDTEMSEGETSGDESGSSSSSGGSLRSSEHSRASRKRAAEESLERKHRRVGQQPFPGATNRGEGGCRIYLQTRGTAERAATDDAIAKNRVGTEIAGDPLYASIDEAAGPSGNRDKVTNKDAVKDMEVNATDLNFDATPGPSPATAYATPFVAVNAVFNVPAQMLRIVDLCASADARDVIPARESRTVATTSDAAVAAAAP